MFTRLVGLWLGLDLVSGW